MQASPSIQHYENFPVASFLCPPALRAPIAAIYHFARTADDLADEGQADAATRLAQLQDYRQALHALYLPGSADAHSAWPQVFSALQQAVTRHHLPQALLEDLLDAFVQDVQMTRDAARYADDAAVMDYCRRSANPVGRLLLHLYGVDDARALAHSDAICSALQLINFWQDLRLDIPRGRFYLSDAARLRCGVAQEDVLALRQSPQMATLVAACVADARALMLRGAPLVHRLPGRAGWELRLVVQGGLRILDKIAQGGYATLLHRPVLRAWDLPVLLWRALLM